METFEQPNPAGIWGATRMYSWDKVPELLRLEHKLSTESMDLDPDLAIINTFGYMQAYDVWLGFENFRHATHTNASTWPKYLQPFERVEGVPNATRVVTQPVSNVTLEMAEGSPEGDRNLYGTFTYHPSIELEQKILDLYVEYGSSVKNMSRFLPVAVMQPLSRTMIKKMQDRGGNALGIAESGEEGPLTIFFAGWRWADRSDDERSFAAYYHLMERAEAAAKDMGIWHPFKYINYAEATQDVWAGLGEKNLKGLRRVQREVDPEGVFAKGGLGGGYFKLNELPDKKDGGKGKGDTSKSEL
jgi:hypothetical protein